MKTANVYANGIFSGILTQYDDYSYAFRYDPQYVANPRYEAISLTLPKREEEYRSDVLFPFFFNLLSEGANKTMQSRMLKVDEKDYFALLLKTAHTDTIGAITIKEVK